MSTLTKIKNIVAWSEDSSKMERVYQDMQLLRIYKDLSKKQKEVLFKWVERKKESSDKKEFASQLEEIKEACNIK